MIIEPLLNWWGITISIVVILFYGSFLFAKSKEDMIEEMKATRTDEFLDKPMLRVLDRVLQWSDLSDLEGRTKKLKEAFKRRGLRRTWRRQGVGTGLSDLHSPPGLNRAPGSELERKEKFPFESNLVSSQEKSFHILRRFIAFNHLGDVALRRISKKVTELKLAKGETLFSFGKTVSTPCMFLCVEGEISVSLPSGAVLRTVLPGQMASSTIGVLAGLTNQRLVCSVNGVATKETKLIKILSEDIRTSMSDKHMTTRLIRTISLRLQRVLFMTLTGYFGLTTGLFKTENFVPLDTEDENKEEDMNKRIARALGIQTCDLPPSVTICRPGSPTHHNLSSNSNTNTSSSKETEKTKTKRGNSMSPPKSPFIRKRVSSTVADSPLVLASTRTKTSSEPSSFVKEILYLKHGDRIIAPGDAPVLYVYTKF
jgi:hypothetical protein